MLLARYPLDYVCTHICVCTLYNKLKTCRDPKTSSCQNKAFHLCLARTLGLSLDMDIA